MPKDFSNDILYEIAKNEKKLNEEQLGIILLIVKAFKLENEFLENNKLLEKRA